MKKKLSVVLLVLALISMCVVITSCSKKAEPAAAEAPVQTEAAAAPAAETATQEVPSAITLKCDPILPKGSGTKIDPWTVAENGKKGLPAFRTQFTLRDDKTTSETNVTPELKAALAEACADPSFFQTKDGKPKNVIVMIGDGMGVSHLNISREYKGELIMDLLPYHAEAMTKCYMPAISEENLADKTTLTTTDSSAGGTAILTGYKTRYDYIGLDRDGNVVPNLSELAKSMGKKIAAVTNDHSGDATPADATVHTLNRDNGDAISIMQLLLEPDLIFGSYGGFESFINADSFIAGTQKDGLDSVIVDQMKADAGEAGGKITFKEWWASYRDANKSDSDYNAWFERMNFKRYTSFGDLVANKDNGDRLIGSWDVTTSMEKTSKAGFRLSNKAYPSFPEMVAYTLSHMQSISDENGFFCMIENTSTDGWGHLDPNAKSKGEFVKAGYIMNEVQNFDEGVAIAVKFVLENPDTLLVITADHETGTMMTKDGWKDDYSKIKSGGSGHSGQNVPVIALGVGAEVFASDTPRENDVTGQLIGRVMGDPTFGNVNGYKD
ncbi:MAG: alkaline phosphatase [Treponema sp.]|nr:alkaline phosphatase [Candidatus Treponema caballi]